MTITLELPEDLARRLKADAQAQGRAPEELAAEAITERYSPLPTLEGAAEALTRDEEDLSGVLVEQHTVPLEDEAESRMFSALSDAKEAAQTLDRERGTNWTEVTGELIERLRLEAAGGTDADAA